MYQLLQQRIRKYTQIKIKQLALDFGTTSKCMLIFLLIGFYKVRPVFYTPATDAWIEWNIMMDIIYDSGVLLSGALYSRVNVSPDGASAPWNTYIKYMYSL